MSGGPSSAGPAPTLPGTGKVAQLRAGSWQCPRAPALGLTAAPGWAAWLLPRQAHRLSWDMHWGSHSDKHRSAFFTLALTLSLKADNKETSLSSFRSL